MPQEMDFATALGLTVALQAAVYPIPVDPAKAPERVARVKSDGTLDFPSLADWWAARKGDLPARGVREIAEVYGGGSVGDLLMLRAEATTDANRYAWVRAAAGQGHGGVFDSSKAYVNGLTDNPLWIFVPHTRIGPGISVRSTVADSPHAVLISDMGAGEVCVVDGIIARVAAGTVFRAEYCEAATFQIFRNCVAERADAQSSVGFRATNASIRVYHCLAWTGDFSIYADNDGGLFGHPAQAGIVESQNCYFAAGTCYHATGAGSEARQGTKDWTSSAEATDPAHRSLAPADAGLTSPSQDALDARLLTGSVLRGSGADLASVAEDFQGQGRPDHAPDTGPDQFAGERDLHVGAVSVVGAPVALVTVTLTLEVAVVSTATIDVDLFRAHNYAAAVTATVSFAARATFGPDFRAQVGAVEGGQARVAETRPLGAALSIVAGGRARLHDNFFEFHDGGDVETALIPDDAGHVWLVPRDAGSVWSLQ